MIVTGGKIHFDEFLLVMNNQLKSEDPKKEILEAFRQSDKTKMGAISVAEFRNTMTRFGERLSEREGRSKELSSRGVRICKR